MTDVRGSRTVGIVVWPGVEPLDFVGPFEVFALARTANERGEEHRLFRPLLLAEAPGRVAAYGGLKVEPDHAIDDAPPLDVLVVPGGGGSELIRLVEEGRVPAWIAARAAAGTLPTSVCTGVYLLGAAGLIAGKRVTTHWEAIPYLPRHHPDATVVGGVRFVDEGDVVTAAGVSAGIDMALHLVARFHGPATAAWTARLMEYEGWPPDRRDGSSATTATVTAPPAKENIAP